MRRPGAWIAGALLALGAACPAASAAHPPSHPRIGSTFKGDERPAGPAARPWGLPVKRLLEDSPSWVRLYSSPAIQDGLVLLGSSDKHVAALDLADGKVRWSHALPDRVWGSAPGHRGGGLVAYIGCVDGCVHALALADGKETGRWCGHPHGLMGKADVLSSPLVEGGRLVFGSDDDAVYGADLAGTKVWKVPTGDIVHDNAACAGFSRHRLVPSPRRQALRPGTGGRSPALGLDRAETLQHRAFLRQRPGLCGRWGQQGLRPGCGHRQGPLVLRHGRTRHHGQPVAGHATAAWSSAPATKKSTAWTRTTGPCAGATPPATWCWPRPC